MENIDNLPIDGKPLKLCEFFHDAEYMENYYNVPDPYEREMKPLYPGSTKRIEKIRVHLPDNFPALLWDLAYNVIKYDPKDIYDFCARYFESLLTGLPLPDESKYKDRIIKKGDVLKAVCSGNNMRISRAIGKDYGKKEADATGVYPPFEHYSRLGRAELEAFVDMIREISIGLVTRSICKGLRLTTDNFGKLGKGELIRECLETNNNKGPLMNENWIDPHAEERGGVFQDKLTTKEFLTNTKVSETNKESWIDRDVKEVSMDKDKDRWIKDDKED